MTEVETIRTAVARMRALAEAATPGPWAVPVANVGRVIAPDAPHRNEPIGKTPPYPWKVVADPYFHDGLPNPANAELIAATDPTFVRAVADWLDIFANYAETGENARDETRRRPRGRPDIPRRHR